MAVWEQTGGRGLSGWPGGVCFPAVQHPQMPGILTKADRRSMARATMVALLRTCRSLVEDILGEEMAQLALLKVQ